MFRPNRQKTRIALLFVAAVFAAVFSSAGLAVEPNAPTHDDKITSYTGRFGIDAFSAERKSCRQAWNCDGDSELRCCADYCDYSACNKAGTSSGLTWGAVYAQCSPHRDKYLQCMRQSRDEDSGSNTDTPADLSQPATPPASTNPPVDMAIPDPLEMTLEATRLRKQEAAVAMWNIDAANLPEPAEITLEAIRKKLPAPVEMILEATRRKLPDPVELELKATRKPLPKPVEITLKANRSALPDPVEIVLEANRSGIPAPVEVTLQATRPAAALVAVPPVLNKPLKQAIEDVGEAGLSPAPALGDAPKKRDQLPGHVYATDPAVGDKIAPGSPVTLTAYGERPKRPVPDIAGMKPDAAAGILAESDFVAGKPVLGDPAPDEEHVGLAQGSNPAAGRLREIFSTVQAILYGPVADEPASDNDGLKVVPPLAGLSIEAANARLRQIGLVPGLPTLGKPAPANVEPGSVSGSSPPAGEIVEANTVVLPIVWGLHAADAPEVNITELGPEPWDDEPQVP